MKLFNGGKLMKNMSLIACLLMVAVINSLCHQE